MENNLLPDEISEYLQRCKVLQTLRTLHRKLILRELHLLLYELNNRLQKVYTMIGKLE